MITLDPKVPLGYVMPARGGNTCYCAGCAATKSGEVPVQTSAGIRFRPMDWTVQDSSGLLNCIDCLDCAEFQVTEALKAGWIEPVTIWAAARGETLEIGATSSALKRSGHLQAECKPLTCRLSTNAIAKLSSSNDAWGLSRFNGADQTAIREAWAAQTAQASAQAAAQMVPPGPNTIWVAIENIPPEVVPEAKHIRVVSLTKGTLEHVGWKNCVELALPPTRTMCNMFSANIQRRLLGDFLPADQAAIREAWRARDEQMAIVNGKQEQQNTFLTCFVSDYGANVVWLHEQPSAVADGPAIYVPYYITVSLSDGARVLWNTSNRKLKLEQLSAYDQEQVRTAMRNVAKVAKPAVAELQEITFWASMSGHGWTVAGHRSTFRTADGGMCQRFDRAFLVTCALSASVCDMLSKRTVYYTTAFNSPMTQVMEAAIAAAAAKARPELPPETPAKKVSKKMPKLWIQEWSDGNASAHETKAQLNAFVEAESSGEGITDANNWMPVGKPYRVTVDGYDTDGDDGWVSDLAEEGTIYRAILAHKRAQAAPVFDSSTPRKERIKNQARSLGSAAALGAGLAAIDQSGEMLLDAARHFGDVPFITMLLADPDGREVVKGVMALLVHTAATQIDGIPKHETVARIAELQVTLSSMKLIGPRLGELRKLAIGLAGLGEGLDFDSLPAPQLLAGVKDDKARELETTSNGQRIRS